MSPITFFLLRCLYLMLPGIGANMAPVVVKNHFKKLAAPIDLGKEFKGKRIFGNNKTFRGGIFGIVFSLVLTYIQFVLYDSTFFRALSFFDYSTKWFAAGILIGLGVLFGDLANSFIKRRVGLKPGKQFIPLDQLNSLIGVLLFMLPIYIPSLDVVLVLLLMAFFLHIGFNLIGYYIGLEKTKL